MEMMRKKYKDIKRWFLKKILSKEGKKNKQTSPDKELGLRLRDLEYDVANLKEIAFEGFFMSKPALYKSVSDFYASIQSSKKPVIVFNTNNIDRYGLGYMHILFPYGSLKSGYLHKERVDADLIILWGQFRNSARIHAISQGAIYGKEICFADEGFIKSILPQTAKISDMRYKSSYSFQFDYQTTYYDATRSSTLEHLLNSKQDLTEAQFKIAKDGILALTSSYISKYNHQPIYNPELPRKTVLVIDQAVGDWSITKGGASDDVFDKMLIDAINENPDSYVAVKRHPDMIIDKNRGGGNTRGLIPASDKVIYLNEEINPIALLKCVDKVYVCTSQMGFEALMLEKEVVVYGVPFYSGWGVTDDRSNARRLFRRNRARSVLEIFWFAYMEYTKYVSPKTMRECTLFEVIEYLSELRDEYFHSYGVPFESALKNNDCLN